MNNHGVARASRSGPDRDGLATEDRIPTHVRHDAPPAVAPDLDYTAVRLERLRQAVDAMSIGRVAALIGISRTALSLVLAGKYKASAGRVLDRFERWSSGVDCPYLNERISAAACRDYAHLPRPANPLGLQHYRACRQCPRRPS